MYEKDFRYRCSKCGRFISLADIETGDAMWWVFHTGDLFGNVYEESEGFCKRCHISNPCPKCGRQLIAKWSGVACENEDCDYWFRY